MNLKFVFIALFAFVSFQTQLFAKNHPFDQQFEDKIIVLFFENGVISNLKVDVIISRLEQKRREVVGLLNGELLPRSLLLSELQSSGKKIDYEKFRKKLKENKIELALQIAISNLKEIKENPKNYPKFLNLAYEALELEEAIKIEGLDKAFGEVVQSVARVFQTWKVLKQTKPEDEASNLYDTSSKSFLGANRIALLSKSGHDLSKLDPINSSFWQKPDEISKVDIHQAALGKTLNLYKNTKTDLPDDLVFYFDEVKHSATKPKIDVYSLDAKKKKRKFKLKFAGEMHSDPTVSSLMMALGFGADVTHYVRNATLILGKKTLSDLIKDWEVYYGRNTSREKLVVEDYIVKQGVNRDGENYVVLKETLVEMKPDEIERIGGWQPSNNGNQSLRELRGLYIIQMWLDNNDLKEFNNNRLLLKSLDQKSFEKFHIISDVGTALGSVFREAPKLYSWDMISKRSKKDLDINFRSSQRLSLRNKITFSDARWAARLIAELTRDQIKAAVRRGGWPQCVQDIYVEKLVSRRNNLVKELGLLGETLSSGQRLSLLPLSGSREDYSFESRCGKESAQISKDYTTDFSYNFESYFKSMSETLFKKSVDLVRTEIVNQNSFVISPAQVGAAPGVISEVLVRFQRNFEKNEAATGMNDQILVEDTFIIGFRLGVSFGMFKDFVYERSYTLVYPSRSSMAKDLPGRDVLVNFLLPRDVARGELPDQYVLKIEHFVQKGVGFETQIPLAPVDLNVSLGRGKVTLLRSVLDKRGVQKPFVYIEKSQVENFYARGDLRFLIFRIPLVKFVSSWGSAQGKGFYLTEPEALTNNGTENLRGALISGDFSYFNNRLQFFDFSNHFTQKSSRVRFLGRNFESKDRADQARIVVNGKDRDQTQFESFEEKKTGFGFLGGVESESKTVRIFSALQGDRDSYVVELDIHGFDIQMKDEELTKTYLNFANSIHPQREKIITLTPSLGYTTNGKWGTLLFRSKLRYSETGVDKLMSVTEKDFIQAVSEYLNSKPDSINELRSRYLEFKRNDSNLIHKNAKLRMVGLNSQQVSFVEALNKVLAEINKLERVQFVGNKVDLIAKVFKRSLYTDSNGFYSPLLLGALNRIIGVDNIYAVSSIGRNLHEEINLIEDVEPYGEWGNFNEVDTKKYLIFIPRTASELYQMFDSWSLN